MCQNFQTFKPYDMSQPYFEGSAKMKLTLPKLGLGSPLNFRIRLQGSKHLALDVLYIIGKLLKCRCRKWPHMGHLDIYKTSYGKKKGRESNKQFDSLPLKVRNRPHPNACRWSATHRWKALEESYKFALDLIPIGGLSKKLWSCKVSGV